MTRCRLATFALLAAAACGGEKPAADDTPQAAATPNVVEITAVDRTFQAPDSITAGWVTFRFTNTSSMTHFALVEHLPEGADIARQQAEVAPVFQEGMDLLSAGKADEAVAAFGKLPAWFGQIVFTGGPGLTAPGHVSETTVHLDPGTYLLECYVKTDGVFHSVNPDTTAYGMVHQLTVTGPASPAPEPEADLTLTLSAARGIEVSGTPTAGTHTVAVRFEDQGNHENFVGHDVHLVRLADDTDMANLVAWMDWTQPTGLQTSAPAEFLGGVNEMPAGSTGYFTATLEPGRYAWIAEVPHTDTNGMLQEFTVPADG